MKPLRLRDRLDGSVRQLNADDPLLDGRWVLEQAATCNGHTPFERGDLLLDDGAPRLRLGPAEAGFVRTRQSKKNLDDYRVALDAVAAIDAKTDLQKGCWPSPLLPAELGQESDSTELDTLLDEVVERGHLDTIATRPRLNMRYDTELLPVDRARRLDTGFQRHLAAHSECWAARTISGVVPKSVLGRISEDDADIYEHRVYARLLDHLEEYLRKRIGKLASIGDRYEEGLEFSNSESVDYRLRSDICAVWGEAVSEGDADDLLKRNREQAKHLECLLKRVRTLKGRRIKGFSGGSLYEEIPRSAQVGLGLIATNLLQHDGHYRQLRRLWQAWLAVSSAERERPAQVLKRRRNEQARYERYVGLVLLRALKALGFETTWSKSGAEWAKHRRWDDRVAIRSRNHGWLLEMGKQRLMLVPVASPLDVDSAVRWTTCSLGDGAELRVPCLLHAPNHGSVTLPCDLLIPGRPGFLLSPLDLYAEEAMIALVSAWLWQHRIAGFGTVFRRLPSAVADAWPTGGDGRGTDRALLVSMDPTSWEKLRKALTQHANRQLRDGVRLRKRQLDNLSRCPSCEQDAELFNPMPEGFFARCKCGCTWELRDGRFVITDVTAIDPSFPSVGRRSLRITI